MIVLIDNYDSFTYNLWQALAGLGAEVAVHRNDAVTLADIDRLAPEALVLSPGPGRPEHSGVTPELIRRHAGRLPILGVCLGHQAIGQVLGGRVVPGREPRHGKASEIRHHGSGLFHGLGATMVVGRYHSLVLERASLPEQLRVSAECADGTVMAIEHRSHPLWGVQFHPESILTPEGPALLANFLALARARRQ